MKTLIKGDCLKLMEEQESGIVDLTITSPPYNLGNLHHTGTKKHTPYFDDRPEDEYQTWQIKVLDEIYRLTKEGGSLFYNHKNRIKGGLSITPYSWLLKTKWLVKQELVWFNRSQNFDNIRFYPMTERVYWLVKTPSTQLENSIKHHDLFEWRAEGTDKEHTRAFPEKMVTDIILCFPDAKVIFDPFMGSGTVPLIAEQRGLDYIGIEIDENYYQQAVKRQNAIQQLLLK